MRSRRLARRHPPNWWCLPSLLTCSGHSSSIQTRRNPPPLLPIQLVRPAPPTPPALPVQPMELLQQALAHRFTPDIPSAGYRHDALKSSVLGWAEQIPQARPNRLAAIDTDRDPLNP